ncbi:helix-turn-helix domain-containing protein [Jeotgalibacillus sp. R-1-5s-1]|uniref:helix-turn-helix domain-containing protein n=1 Tax=Jeotgalibacillus sp. R-1-5s-1 TaxID=2555897 RepID=UPI00106D642B|nr:helix-turn-helix transcriptional regulator [Jeotgalibacillus sp. R-1-5s-1]TFD97038.1 XRE family transcriptional regulator [Jeotgalibacillus sp. R-1-5s-1]
MNVGSIIKYYRTKRGMTQTELSEGICSTSHLSKIETNMYAANEETVGMLLDKLGLKLEEVSERLNEMKELLQEFIEAIFTQDRELSKSLYEKVLENKDYMEASELVNLYHLYMYRYRIWNQDLEGAREYSKILHKIKNTFNTIESNVYTFFQAIYFTVTEKHEDAIKLIKSFLENPLPLGNYWIAEAYYQLSYAHISINQNEAGLIASKKAYDIYVSECNFTRQIHSQMIIGICYMRLGLYNEALGIYKPLLRNTRMHYRDSLYFSILINYSRCLYLSKEYVKVQRYIDEVLEIVEQYSPAHATSLLIWLENTLKRNRVNDQWHSRIHVLRKISEMIDSKYYYHYSVYLEKFEFSQVDGVKYAVKWLYPYLIKSKNYSDAREVIEAIIDYYNQVGDPVQAKEYYDQWRSLIEKERTLYD